jgi:Flp pilus assembly protein CpaB
MVLLLFMSNYRNSVAGGGEPMTVLKADRFIDEGTSGDVVAEAQLFETARIREDEASDAVITDPDALRGQVATKEIFPGQQLTEGDFAPGADPIAGKLEGDQRAISVPVDAAHGNIGQVKAGSRVDVLGGWNIQQSGGTAQGVLGVLARDVLVLKAPEEADDESGVTSDKDQEVVLRVTDVEANHIALEAEGGNVWLTIRPPTLAKDSRVKSVSPEDLLGLPTISNGG